MSIASLIAHNLKGVHDVLPMGDLTLMIDRLINDDEDKARTLIEFLTAINKELVAKAKHQTLDIQNTLNYAIEICFLDSRDYYEARTRFEEVLRAEVEKCATLDVIAEDERDNQNEAPASMDRDANADWRAKLGLFTHGLEVLLADPRTPERTRDILSDAVREILNRETPGFDVRDDLRALGEKLQPEEQKAS